MLSSLEGELKAWNIEQLDFSSGMFILKKNIVCAFLLSLLFYFYFFTFLFFFFKILKAWSFFIPPLYFLMKERLYILFFVSVEYYVYLCMRCSWRTSFSALSRETFNSSVSPHEYLPINLHSENFTSSQFHASEVEL